MQTHNSAQVTSKSPLWRHTVWNGVDLRDSLAAIGSFLGFAYCANAPYGDDQKDSCRRVACVGAHCVSRTTRPLGA